MTALEVVTSIVASESEIGASKVAKLLQNM
jgi:hypothetical protein